MAPKEHGVVAKEKSATAQKEMGSEQSGRVPSLGPVVKTRHPPGFGRSCEDGHERRHDRLFVGHRLMHHRDGVVGQDRISMENADDVVRCCLDPLIDLPRAARRGLMEDFETCIFGELHRIIRTAPIDKDDFIGLGIKHCQTPDQPGQRFALIERGDDQCDPCHGCKSGQRARSSGRSRS